MRLRPISKADSNLTNMWRVAHGSPAVPPKALPELGSMALREDGTPIAAMWLYLTNSNMAYLAWPVTSLEASGREAKESLELIAIELLALAESLGFLYVVSTSGSRGLTKLLVRCGMTEDPRKHDFLVMENKPHGD